MNRRPAGKGYALWLMPTGAPYRYLAREILVLSRRCSTPRFEPHVTLLGGIQVPEQKAVARASLVARRLAPLDVRLGKVDSRKDYFRCLFFRVASAPAVIEARAVACEVFGIRAAQPYLPHLSLMYGNLAPAGKKRIPPLPCRSFPVSRLHLYSVKGPPEAWRLIGTFVFGGIRPDSC